MHDPIGDARGAGSPPEPGATDPTPEDALLRAEAGQSVRDAISVLPDRQRSVVMLTQLDGRTTAEVSEILGLSESTVRVHLFRAMRRLRQSMGRLAAATTSGRAHDR